MVDLGLTTNRSSELKHLSLVSCLAERVQDSGSNHIIMITFEEIQLRKTQTTHGDILDHVNTTLLMIEALI